MSESGLLLNVTTSNTSNSVLRKSRKRGRVINNGNVDDDVIARNKVPALPPSLRLSSELDPKQNPKACTGTGLQSFVSKR